ncbi:hypothetical protein GCM10011609_87020 [Lentzea pudingi]|uniref:Uncharacterized protein n=1 Tax=Lentzea pudingi TaxID=1789439 RepID=A0ABQ2IWZ6_9PSEU|nr:hypothetical protein [Lentzea pudingi]GGN29762.1 hypothetical protein GCM10011609_87020 [Lentzea pudingi]
MALSDRTTSTRRFPLIWTLIVLAAALLIAGVIVPHALLIAAGLILAGSIGTRRRP